MITVDGAPFDTLVRQLTAEAQALAEAQARLATMAQNDPSHWRRADLLWPNFGIGRL